MPELPEVETVRRSLEALVTGKTISEVQVLLPRLIRTPSDAKQFEFLMKGLAIKGVERKGKFLLLAVPPYVLVSHLRMEGRYGVYSEHDPVEKHTHLIFYFTDGTQLRYRDVRQFGTFDLLTPETLHLVEGLRTMGPEPLSDAFQPELFWDILQKKSKSIKAALLDQSFLAGLGNIYVDEALFDAGIHPETSCKDIGWDECVRLCQSIRSILQDSVEAGGSSVKSYVNGFGQSGGYQYALRVYGRSGEPCIRCGTPISKTRVAGRGTHFCENCQLNPKRKESGR